MKHLIKTAAVAALLTAPLTACAQSAAAPKAMAPVASRGMTMNCPTTADTSGMQKDMSGMMSEMQAMMKDAKDSAMKERMQKMHERMSAMMGGMQKTGGTDRIMGNGMMEGQQPPNASLAKPETAPVAPVSPDDHTTHHPAQ